MRKPNYGQERAERERAKEAKAKAKEQKRQEMRTPRAGEADGEDRRDEGAPQSSDGKTGP